MRLTIRCKSLREVSTDDGMPCNITAVAEQKESKSYVEASFEGHQKDNVSFYISIPTQLLDDEMRIGDEYELLIARKLN